MDDDLQSLELELKSLRPLAPSPALRERIRAELRAAAPQSRVAAEPAPIALFWRYALPIAAAVAFAFIATRQPARPPVAHTGHSSRAGDSRVATLKPVAAENVLYAAQDEGLVTLEDGTTARRERLKYVDTITWKNPRTNASVTWTVPREEVRVVPVRFQ